jgi:D-glycero-D-manno-heptose 1,7-bisphosphate phosphatase
MESLKVVFLDRDGVINEKQAEGDYVTEISRFKFNPGIFEILKRFNEDGFKFIILTNQRGIARGLMTENDLEAVHAHMKEGLRKNGIEILDIFHCPHDFDSCECRKPKSGMLQSAARKYAIDLNKSILISDSRRDVEMGEKFGIGKNILIKHNSPEEALEILNVS